jgi:hypothetical protein
LFDEFDFKFLWYKIEICNISITNGSLDLISLSYKKRL